MTHFIILPLTLHRKLRMLTLYLLICIGQEHSQRRTPPNPIERFFDRIWNGHPTLYFMHFFCLLVYLLLVRHGHWNSEFGFSQLVTRQRMLWMSEKATQIFLNKTRLHKQWQWFLLSSYKAAEHRLSYLIVLNDSVNSLSLSLRVYTSDRVMLHSCIKKRNIRWCKTYDECGKFELINLLYEPLLHRIRLYMDGISNLQRCQSYESQEDLCLCHHLRVWCTLT